jgi:ABC-type transport system substrate-binding protein
MAAPQRFMHDRRPRFTSLAMTHVLAKVFLGAALLAAAAGPWAKTLRVAVQGDALSMDPHSLAEAVQLSFTGNVYEPLVTRDKQLKLAPPLEPCPAQCLALRAAARRALS